MATNQLRRSLLRLMGLAVLTPCLALAQDPASATTAQLTFAATDKQDKPVVGLQVKDVVVRDQGKAADIISIEADSEAPLHIALVLDISGSMRVSAGFKPGAIRGANTLQKLLRKGRDEAALLVFGPDTYLVRGFSDDLSSWERAISDLKPGGGSRLFDAVSVVAQHLSRRQQAEPSARAVMVVLSDGYDNASDSSSQDALAAALRSEMTIYAIDIGSSGRRGDEALKQLAQKTGGLLLQPMKVLDMEEVLRTIVSDLHSRYTVRFRPRSPAGDKFHRVEISAGPRTRVRAAGGYRRADHDSTNGHTAQVRPTAAGTRLYVPSKEMQQYVESQVPPEYPVPQKGRLLTGRVILRVAISREGAVLEVEPVSGAEGLLSPTVEAVRRWRYRPYLRDGVAGEVETEVTVDFRVGH